MTLKKYMIISMIIWSAGHSYNMSHKNSGVEEVLTTFVGEAKANEQPATFLELVKKIEIPILDGPTAVSWAPDGKSLAVASFYGGNITVFDELGHRIAHFQRKGGGPAPGNSLSFVNGALQIVSNVDEHASNDIALNIYDSATGEMVKSIIGPAPGEDYSRNKAINYVVSPDQSLLAFSPAIGNQVVVYQTASWRLIQIIQMQSVPNALEFTPDSKRLAVGTLSGDCILVDPISGKKIKAISAYDNRYGNIFIGSVAMDPTGSLLLTATKGGSMAATAYVTNNKGAMTLSPAADAWTKAAQAIRIWRIEDGTQVNAFQTAVDPIRQAIWDPKDRFVAFLDANNRLYLWQPMLKDSKVLTMDFPSVASSLAITRDGKYLAVAHGKGVAVFTVNQTVR